MDTFYTSFYFFNFQILIIFYSVNISCFAVYVLILFNTRTICGLFRKFSPVIVTCDIQPSKNDDLYLSGFDEFNRHPVAFANGQIFLFVFILKF